MIKSTKPVNGRRYSTNWRVRNAWYRATAASRSIAYSGTGPNFRLSLGMPVRTKVAAHNQGRPAALALVTTGDSVAVENRVILFKVSFPIMRCSLNRPDR